MIPRIFLPLVFLVTQLALSGRSDDLFDLAAIRDAGTLETEVVEDWRPHPTIAGIQQKLVVITVAEWWSGQKVRIPVTFNAPTDPAQLPCRNVIVANMPLNLRMATPNGPERTLLMENGVGVVLVGMGTIDAMEPVGQLHLGMKEQLLKTKSPRYATAWIWGMSQMRGLTAAAAESNYFKPEKVIATGGSKRGIATAVAGIHDDRFTAIMPVVAPPMGNPGSVSSLLGAEPEWIEPMDQAFLETVDAGVRNSLLDRKNRREADKLTVEAVKAAGWSRGDIQGITDRLWDASRMTKHIESVKKRGLVFFYNVGTNDSVSPALLELGRRFPGFPINIIPGGQHGGPSDAGFTRRVTIEPGVVRNFEIFCRAHFFGARSLPEAPGIEAVRQGSNLVVTAQFKTGAKPIKNELAWSFDRHVPYTLFFEYDSWETTTMQALGKNKWQAKIPIPDHVKTVQFLSTHTDVEHGLPFSFSSALKEKTLRK